MMEERNIEKKVSFNDVPTIYISYMMIMTLSHIENLIGSCVYWIVSVLKEELKWCQKKLMR